MLAGRREKRDIPHESGEWIEFRTLSGRELDDAEDAAVTKAMARIKGFDSAVIEAMTGRETRQPQPGDSYDKDTLIRYAVVGWSYGEACNPENTRNLDAATRDWAVSVILEMNTRPLTSTGGSEPNSNGTPSRESLATPTSS